MRKIDHWAVEDKYLRVENIYGEYYCSTKDFIEVVEKRPEIEDLWVMISGGRWQKFSVSYAHCFYSTHEYDKLCYIESEYNKDVPQIESSLSVGCTLFMDYEVEEIVKAIREAKVVGYEPSSTW